jgi:hypothetical protein
MTDAEKIKVLEKELKLLKIENDAWRYEALKLLDELHRVIEDNFIFEMSLSRLCNNEVTKEVICLN